jgi:hypothetical protein
LLAAEVDLSKIIIENRSKMSDEEAMLRVMEVVKIGRISGTGDKKQYCYHTRFACGFGFCAVSAFKNKASDRFVVVDS